MSRTSRTPVTLGLTAVGLAVVGLSILLYGTYIGGFAGLADPRSERFLRPASRPLYQGWQSWTAAGPRPADDPAPAGGYTVP
ncbi:hypothetical protein OHA72_11095 [Dactylosporangium sp. NBC_01737]|uniref:hypothetical protein n=1 Tax=Dactylosporangium sp. NBC_01737 TaxID=2975959 RepID=UPI002E120ED4|nr:hypothetical protein OHA72_11095 [Dactylosporangium sp. NBC_01737]